MRLDFHAVRAFARGDDETPFMTKYFEDWHQANRWAARQAKKYKTGAINFEADYTAPGCDYKEHKWIDWEDHWSNKD